MGDLNATPKVYHVHAVSPERDHLEITFPRVVGYPTDESGEEVPQYESRRGPGRTRDVDFWTSRSVREASHCHLNYLVLDTAKWEQSAAYYVDTDDHVVAFARNANLGFAIPYVHQGQSREYVPDFLVRLRKDEREVGTLILETKGFDPLTATKVAAARRWVAAVNAEGAYGRWAYRIAASPSIVPAALASAARELAEPPRPGWRAALSRFVEDVRAEYGSRLQSVVLYGSRARGDAEHDSDVDVLVVLDPCEDSRAERERVGAIGSRVTVEYDAVVSAFAVSLREYEESGLSILVNARREGKVVAGRVSA